MLPFEIDPSIQKDTDNIFSFTQFLCKKIQIFVAIDTLLFKPFIRVLRRRILCSKQDSSPSGETCFMDGPLCNSSCIPFLGGYIYIFENQVYLNNLLKKIRYCPQAKTFYHRFFMLILVSCDRFAEYSSKFDKLGMGNCWSSDDF